MLLKNKTAVIYAAGGAIGQTVARAFAHEGAKVFITGRNKEKLDTLASSIRANGGFAEAQVVDALDGQAVDNHLKSVLEKEGSVDISFNAMGIPQTGVQGIPLTQLTPNAFMHPIENYLRSHFITATSAARQMTLQQAGVILTLTATPVKMAVPLMGGMSPSWAGIEGFTRNLAAETGAQGVRVVCLRAAGMPETNTITEVFGLHAKGMGLPSHKDFEQLMASRTLLKRAPTVEEVANTAVFLASDKGSGITGTTINITCGLVVD